MKRTLIWLCLTLLAVQPVHSASGDADLARFAYAKEAQAREFASELTNKVPSITWSFFDAVKVDDWQTATQESATLQNTPTDLVWNKDPSHVAIGSPDVWPFASHPL